VTGQLRKRLPMPEVIRMAARTPSRSALWLVKLGRGNFVWINPPGRLSLSPGYWALADALETWTFSGERDSSRVARVVGLERTESYRRTVDVIESASGFEVVVEPLVLHPARSSVSVAARAKSDVIWNSYTSRSDMFCC
jgi:hypothetical protein